MIIPYLRDMINNHKAPIKLKSPSGGIIDEDTFREWKIQLKMQIHFISSKDSTETRTMDTKSDNMEIMMGSETDDITYEFLNVFCEDIRKN